MEETRPGVYFPIVEDDRGTYIFNSKDLCLISQLPALMACGLDSFKIEGRMKSVYYVASVVKVYREAIDNCFAALQDYVVRSEWWEELQKISHRDYTTAFCFGKTDAEDQIYGSSSYIQPYDFVGLVKGYNSQTHMAIVEQRNAMKVGDVVEIVQPGKAMFRQQITAMYDQEGTPICSAPHPQQLLQMPMDQEVADFSMLRRQVLTNE
jgi:U32 family peptidase